MISFKKRIVLHACCAVCLGGVLEVLKLYPEIYTEGQTEIFVFFYNPNIFPLAEYERRKAEVIMLCADKGLSLQVVDSDEESQVEFYKNYCGLECEPERGLRCKKCFELRLIETARYAMSIGADWFSTTLSVSPHKNFARINQAANSVANVISGFNIPFLEVDFKKKNGFKLANEVATKYGFYRQKYCGCRFSIRDNDNSKNIS